MCDQCREMHSKRKPPTDPPCATCWVDLMPENTEAAEVYMVNRRQYITAGMGQPIDVSIQSIIETMKIYPGGVKDQWKCLQKVRGAILDDIQGLKDNED